MKGGKTAVRRVFTCDDGRTKFVAYLEMYAPLDKAALEEVLAKGRGAVPHQGGIPMVKRPGDKEWVALTPDTTAAYESVVTVKCPDGRQENLSRVFPE